MRRSREIGWNNAEILLYESFRATQCVCVPSTTTTTSTTVAPCEGPDCATNLIVGNLGTLYGYANGDFGSLDAVCTDVIALYWDSSAKTVSFLTGTCYDSVIIQIDGREFVPSFMGGGIWTASSVEASPFAPVNFNSIIRICGVPCTTTTTTTLPE